MTFINTGVRPIRTTGALTFISHPIFIRKQSNGYLHPTSPPSLKYVVRRSVTCASDLPAATTSDAQKNKLDTATPSTEDVFAIDAGRDLFFSGMDEAKAIQILGEPLGQLEDIEDRFIAAERLKFFATSDSAQALMSFIRRFDTTRMNDYILEDRIARRKSVESLGRHKGAFHVEQVSQFLTDLLNDADALLVETAVWSLAEMGVILGHTTLEKVMEVLDNDDVEKRVVVQTLLRSKYMPALPRLRNLTESDDVGVASAAMAAVATLSGETEVMQPVISILRSNVLNERRSAMEDITIAKFIPAMHQVAVCPSSLVLRARTVRVLLDAQKQNHNSTSEMLDDHMARLIDRLIWDHPGDLDLLGMKKETRKSRDVDRNIRQLYKNDALFPYLASKTLAEDHRDKSEDESDAAAAVLKSYNDMPYFDYFGAYHVYKTLGWLRYRPAYDLLLENAITLPPRFFNHKAGAVTALAELGNVDAIPAIEKIAREANIWEVKYACLIASERLGDSGKMRQLLANDPDWLISARCKCDVDFSHLKNSFPKDI